MLLDRYTPWHPLGARFLFDSYVKGIGGRSGVPIRYFTKKGLNVGCTWPSFKFLTKSWWHSFVAFEWEDNLFICVVFLLYFLHSIDELRYAEKMSFFVTCASRDGELTFE